ncbi:hypothetical protein [Kitasatospora sp. NPDC059571]|uniref:hypothetical protein n=1 Tax=Kitasatospora sp. NPDC059571 TaxID=3346871 RepID=UPI0036BC4057
MNPCRDSLSCTCSQQHLAEQARAWSLPRHRRPAQAGTAQAFDSFLSKWGRARREDLRSMGL